LTVSLRGVCLLLPILSSAAPAAAPVPILVRDVPLRGELVEGGTHAYRVDLREGEALRAVVEQRGIDVVVALRGPRGGIEVEMDGVSGGRGTEELAWEAAQAGVYLVEVQPRAANAPPGGYSLTVHVSARADAGANVAIANRNAPAFEARPAVIFMAIPFNPRTGWMFSVKFDRVDKLRARATQSLWQSRASKSIRGCSCEHSVDACHSTGRTQVIRARPLSVDLHTEDHTEALLRRLPLTREHE